MNKNIKKGIFLSFSLLLLSSCVSVPQSYSNSPVNSNIREIDLLNLGSNKYSLLIRGNAYTSQSGMRGQFIKEVVGVCGEKYEIQEIETSEIVHSGYKKPIIQGIFICK